MPSFGPGPRWQSRRDSAGATSIAVLNPPAVRVSLPALLGLQWRQSSILTPVYASSTGGEYDSSSLAGSAEDSRLGSVSFPI